jgi:hypothetical protein
MKPLFAALLLPCSLAAAEAHRVTVAAGPEPTPEQRQQQLHETTADVDDLQAQLDTAVASHADRRQIEALRRALADHQTMVLLLRYREIFDTLLKATLANDLDQFRSVCDDTMKAAITAEALASASASLHGALGASPYVVLPAGSMMKQGQAVLLYVIRPDDGADDLLVMMSLEHDRCSGFVLK